MLLLIITTILFFSNSLILERLKTDSQKITLGMNCIEVIEEIANKHGISTNNIEIEINKIYSYSVIYNSIRVTNLQSNKMLDVVATAHEIGHYIKINTSKKTRETYKTIQYIIAVNRLVIMPLYIIIAVGTILNLKTIMLLYNLIKEIMLSIFIISSILKIIMYFPHEIIASKTAMTFIRSNFDDVIVKSCKRIYLLSFLSQVFFSMMAILGIIQIITRILN